ncbi:MAG TPA: hypothetical protein PLW69_06730, partial [Agitococcus sp.]|nr:hypothetical protein [Agitococcus sp.]
MNKPTLLALAIFCVPTAYAQSNQMISSGSQFNPAMSLILDGNYSHDNQKGLSGAALDGMAGIGHSVSFSAEEAGLQNGFNLGESELVLSAVVDPYFDGLLIMTVSGDGATALEESWLQTRLLPAGLKVKMGKFLSGIGYQNSQ